MTTQLGRMIKQARTAKGLTQQELSRLSHVSRSYICELERGSRTTDSMELLAALAHALGYQPTHFYKATGWLENDAAELAPEVEVLGNIYDSLQEGPFKEQARTLLIELARAWIHLAELGQQTDGVENEEIEAVLDRRR